MMNSILAHKRQGTITVILVGLLAVMMLFTAALARRMSGHTQLLTVGDYTQIARYFLESYVGDVLRQIKLQANDPDSPVYAAFRDPAGNVAISASAYSQSNLLKALQSEIGISVLGNPVIKITETRPLTYPPAILCPADKEGIEKLGHLSIECRVRFRTREYTLVVDYPFVTAMSVTPILKDFVFFADRVDREQLAPFGRFDKLNVMFTEEGEHPLDVPPDFSAYSDQRPWLINPPLNPDLARNPHYNGRVFLGDDDRIIHLNLAGSDTGRARASEMFHIWPNFFKVAAPNQRFKYSALFMKEDGQSYVELLGMDVELRLRGHIAKMGVIGFCYELYDSYNGIFAQSRRKLEDFLRNDPSYTMLVNEGQKAVSLASGLKFLGLNDPTWDEDQFGPYMGVPRQIFGQVAARFFLLTFFEYPSAQGGGQSLAFDENPSPTREYPRFFGMDPVKFEPREPSQTYRDFMSRIVSGGADYSGGPFPENYMPYNPIVYDSATNDYTWKKSVLTFHDFCPADGFRLQEKFSTVGSQWFNVSKRLPLFDERAENVQSRISVYFESARDFKDRVGYHENRFHVGGVVYVDGPLELEDLTMPVESIRGGVVLVNGPITLGNITQGFTGDINAPDYVQQLDSFIEALDQSTLLTFVSLTGQTILLRGNIHLGVHLISMHPDVGTPVDQIDWDTNERIVFAGAIACNTPNIKKRVKDFGVAQRSPIFFYVPAMGRSTPNVSTVINTNMRGYSLTGSAATTGG